jgi:hypothetical protein
MPICEHRKLAFCHIPRTGGVSISAALKLKVVDKHYPASWYRTNYPDYFLFATNRSYEDRIRSTFGWRNDERYRKGSLEELVAHIKNKGSDNIGLMIKPNEYFLDCEVDCLLDFNNLEQDLNKMLFKLGHPCVTLQQINSFK